MPSSPKYTSVSNEVTTWYFTAFYRSWHWSQSEIYTHIHFLQRMFYFLSSLNTSGPSLPATAGLEFQRITAQQTQVHLRLSWGSVHLILFKYWTGWPDLRSSLCPWQDLRLYIFTSTQNNKKFRFCTPMYNVLYCTYTSKRWPLLQR